MAENEKPTKEDLVEDLRNSFNGIGMTYQGYIKLNEIVEGHFQEKESLEAIKTQIEHDQKYIRPIQIKQKKSTVTREWVNDLIGLAVLAGGTGDYRPLDKKLKGLGVGVVKKE